MENAVNITYSDRSHSLHKHEPMDLTKTFAKFPEAKKNSLSFSAWIFDVTRSYHLAFFISGGLFACAGCLGSLTQLIASKSAKRAWVFDSTSKDHDTEAIKIKENECC